MRKLVYILILLLGIFSATAETIPALRTFPPNTIFATIQKVDLPQIKIQEIPSNWGSSLLGLILLSTATIEMSPATVIRDTMNGNQVQGYISKLINQPVAIQFDFQHRAWVIWQLTPLEVKWILKNKWNTWQKNAIPTN